MKKSTVLALLVFLGLGVLVWQQLGEKHQRGISRVTFSQIDISTMDVIDISGKHPVKLVRKGGEWLVDGGRRAEANAVKRALESVVKIDSTKVITRKEQRFNELKVDAAEGTKVSLREGGNIRAEFVIGSAGAGGSNILVDGTVYSMKGVFPGTFARPLASWTDRALMDAAAKDVVRVDVSLAGETPFSLVAGEGESPQWALADLSSLPKGFRFDYEAARSVVSTVVGLQAREFVESTDDVSKMGLSDTADRLEVHFKDGEKASQTLVLGSSLGEKLVYGQLLPTKDMFTLSSHSAKLLRRRPLEFRDLRLMDFEVADVTGLTIVEEQKKTELVREESGWKVAGAKPAAPDGFRLDPMAVEGKLHALKNFRAHSLAENVSPRKAKFKKAAMFVRLVFKDGSSTQLQVGQATKFNDEPMRYGRGNADGGIYHVNEASLNVVFGGLESLQMRNMPPGGGLGNIDPAALSQLPPEIREQLVKQLEEERRKQQMMRAYQEQRKAQ